MDDDDDINDNYSIREAREEENLSTSIHTNPRQWFTENFTLLELSGSCGDFGTVLPLLIQLARQRAIYLAPTLLGTGVCHILNGILWDLPMPLQPMKAISTLAIASELSRNEVTAAGIGMGILFIVLAVWKSSIEFLHKYIPYSIIGGLQLGVGWKLAIRGIQMIELLPWLMKDPLDCKIWAILCSLLCLYYLRNSQNHDRQNDFPIGLVLFGLGVVLAIARLVVPNDDDQEEDPDSTTTTLLVSIKEPFLLNAVKDISWKEWKAGLLDGTLPQLPLTTLNSCLSVCLLAGSLFPNKPAVTRQSVCWSIGLMNVLLCPLGCMPNCHGAGGLAGQSRLGAKSGLSMVMLGLFKIGLSVLAHYGVLLRLLDALPVSIMSVLLILAGHELASTGVLSIANRMTEADFRKDDMAICLLTGLVIVGCGKTHIGALCGWITYVVHGNGYQELFVAQQSTDINSNSHIQYSNVQQDASMD